MSDSFDGTFSLFQMLWGNVVARPLRSFLSVFAIAIQVILVLLIVGLTSGVLSEWGKRVEGVGADLLVQPPNSSIFFAFSSAVMNFLPRFARSISVVGAASSNTSSIRWQRRDI